MTSLGDKGVRVTLCDSGAESLLALEMFQTKPADPLWPETSPMVSSYNMSRVLCLRNSHQARIATLSSSMREHTGLVQLFEFKTNN